MGHPFFKIGVTFANFQRLGILPLAREKLKSSQNGNDNEWDNSLCSLLLMSQAPLPMMLLNNFVF